MPIETWVYKIDVGVSPSFYKRDTETFTIYRETTPKINDMSVYEFVKDSNNTIRGSLTYGGEVAVWRSTQLQFGTLFATDNIPVNSNKHNLGTLGATINTGLLNVGSTSQQITVKAPGTTEAQSTVLLYNRSSFTLTVEVNQKANIATVVNMDGSAYIGREHTVQISESANTHNTFVVKWSVGSASHEEEINSGNTAKWTIADWSYLFSVSETSKDGTITIITKYDDVEIGRKEYSFTVYLGNVGAPEVTLSIVKHNDLTNNWGGTNTYIQGMMGLKVTASASSSDSSSISSYKFSATDNQTQSGSSNIWEINRIASSGAYIISVVVTDAKGRSTTATKQITVFEYHKPTIMSPLATRCVRKQVSANPIVYEYTPNGEGRYAAVRAEADISGINISSSIRNTLTMYAYLLTGNTFIQSNIVGTSISLQSGVENAFDTYLNSSEITQYYVYFVASDSVGGHVELIVPLSSSSFSIHIRDGGEGVAIGQISDGDKKFQIADDWTPMWGAYKMARIYYDPDPNKEPAKIEGLIWLKPKT